MSRSCSTSSSSKSELCNPLIFDPFNHYLDASPVDAIAAILAPEIANTTRFDLNTRCSNPSSCPLSPGPPLDSATHLTPCSQGNPERLQLNATPIPDRSAIPIRSPKRPDSPHVVCDESGLEVASASRLLTSAQRGHSRCRTASIRIFGKSRRLGASSPDGEVAISSVDWSQRLRVLPMTGRVHLSQTGGRGPLTWSSNQSCKREQRRVLSSRVA